jgi:hypothetical protein
MTREQARRSRYRNSITRFIGSRAEVEPDVETIPLQEGDTVLLCSDGLTTEASDAEIARILAGAPSAQEASDRLVEAALRNGGSDNITVVVLRYGEFTPLATASRIPAARPEREEEEEDTDPTAEWRTARRQNGSRARTTSLPEPIASADEDEEAYADDSYEDDEEAYEESRYERNRTAVRQAEGGVGLATILCLVLLLVAIAEGIALYLALTNRKITPPVITNVPVQDEETFSLPTDKPLNYGLTETLSKSPLRDDFLLVEASQSVLVVAEDGKLLRITRKGKVAPLPGPPLPAPSKTETAPYSRRHENPKPAPPPHVTVDNSGNAYRVNPATKCIEKYDTRGTRVAADIGKGSLTAPAALAVDKYGNLFVIDAHRLKKIQAIDALNRPVEENPTTSAPGGAGVEPR